MKKLLLVIPILFCSNLSLAESLDSYISNQLEETCSIGETITILELSTLLRNLTPAQPGTNGCSLYSNIMYASPQSAGLTTKDGYSNRILAIKLIGNYKTRISADSFTLRDNPLCIKRFGGDSMTISYQLKAETMDTYPAKLYGNEVHDRKSVIEITNNQISWAGQIINNSERSMYLVNRSRTSRSFRCGETR